MQTKELSLPFKKVKITPVSLDIDQSVLIDEWIEIGDFLKRSHKAVQFWIGDWLNFGEKKYGETYAQALDQTEYDYQALKDIKWTCASVEKSRRRDNVSFSAHREVAPLDPKDQDKILAQASEKGLTNIEIRQLVKDKRKESLPAPKLPDGKYQVIYADPPWDYGMEQHTHEKQDTVLETHYPTMATEAIAALPIKDLAGDNAVLFLWTTSPKLFESKQVIDGWGFDYKTSMVWDKVKHNVGYYVSVRHEFLLICTKGSCLPDNPKLHDSVVTLERGEHSAKPEIFYEIIEDIYKGKKIELFARQKRKGWDQWGNQL